MCGRSSGTNTGITAFLLVRRRTPQALHLASPALRCEPLLDGFAVWPRRPPPLPHLERAPERGDEALEGELAVPELAALVLRDRPDRRAEARDHPLLLHVGERRRGLDLEERLDAGFRLLRMLAAGATRPGGAEADLGAPDRDAPRDPDPVGTRLARDGVNSALQGCRHVSRRRPVA